jgi:Spy/CpxP family protein refolding chaperone
MRGLLKGALVLGLALAMASAVQAQQRGRGFGPGGMLQNEGVQKELKLTDEQKTKLREAMEKVREDNKDILAKGFQDMTREDREKLAKDTNAAISKVLDEKQMKRFKQIGWQVGGANALNEPEVQKTLKLNDEQKKKLQDIIADSNKKMREAFQGGGGFEKIQEIRKETQEKANGVLTDEQKKSWKEMLGEPFEFQRRQR